MKRKNLLTIPLLLLLSSCSINDVFKLLYIISGGNSLESSSESTIQKESVKTDEKEYNVNFYFEDQLLGSTTIIENNTITVTDNPLEGNPQYEFIGWDANNDGIVETFPYVITKDTTFKALYSIKQYTYKIYVKGDLVYEETANYDSEIKYPEVINEIIDDDVYFFKGWIYNGVYDGYYRETLTEDYVIDACYASSQILKMYYNGQLYAMLIDANESLTFLDTFEITPSTGKEFKWYLDSNCITPFTGNKMIEGNLTLYCKEDYIDANVAGILTNSKEELASYVNTMILNRKESEKFKINFTYDTFDNLIKYVKDNVDAVYSYQINSSLLSDELTLTMTYNDVAVETSNQIYFTQIKSYGYNQQENLRSSTFEDFYVNSISNQFYVNTSEALFYALEHGYRPVIDSNNTNLNNLYYKMKTILRNIISDDMDDVTKARVIYEYLIMNVTYDWQTMSEFNTKTTNELSKKKAFFLEGVFEDNLAVCDGISKAYSSLCSMEGIECVRITGQTYSSTNHAWNKIKINNKWYVVDVTSGGMLCNDNEILSYSFFMISDSQYSTFATSDNKYYSSIECKEKYDVYSLINRKASNTAEAATLLTDFFENIENEELISFDVQFDYEYDDFDEEIKNIYDLISVSWLSTNNSYSLATVTTFDSITFIYSKD